MRILHTSDWHLGRSLEQISLLSDQNHLLNQLVAMCQEYRPHALVIAGDVYDRAIPPVEAVRLLNDILERLVKQVGVGVLMISGNHDSPERLTFGAQIMAPKLILQGNVGRAKDPIILHDEHGPVFFHLLPYAEPATVSAVYPDPLIEDHAQAMAIRIQDIQDHALGSGRSIAIAHAFVVGGEISDSERILSVGGSGAVPRSLFQGFQYTALGHLHRPQSLGSTIRYAGSLFPYSFNESAQTKSITFVEMDGQGAVRVEAIPLSLQRQVRVVKGFFNELKDHPNPVWKEDYLQIQLLDENSLFDPMGQLQQVYPHLLSIQRPGLFSRNSAVMQSVTCMKSRGIPELFADFYQEVGGRALNDAERTVLQDILQDLARQEQEAG